MAPELQKAHTGVRMDADEHVPRTGDRDRRDLNAHLKVGFEDVIAEPPSARSFDSVWIGGHAAFELAKFGCYRGVSALLAVPAAFLLGLLFGLLSCVHVWVLMPAIRSLVMLLPSIQVVWRAATDAFVTPLFQSMGKALSSVHVTTDEN